MKITQLLNNPNKWTKNCLALNKDGKTIHEHFAWTITEGNKTFETDSMYDATSFSLYGALVYCYESHKRIDVIKKLKEAIQSVTGKYQKLPEFNDDVDTNFKQVREVIELANV